MNSSSRRVAVLVLLYLLLVQVGLGYAVPDRWLYQHRVDYEVFKNEPAVLDIVLDQIHGQIERERLTDYVILLGDSVGYSGPGGPEQSIGYYMEQISREQGRPLTVFNLSLPAMQTGDIYTVLLKLRARSIPTDRVAINLLYAGWVARDPYPPAVFWLADDLKRLDPAGWERVQPNLAATGRISRDPIHSRLFNQQVAPHVAVLQYRPVLKAQLLKAVGATRREVYDTRPWTEKPWLKNLLQEHQYAMGFNPAPFVMAESNPQTFFLNQMIQAARDSQVLFYLTPTNQVLMADKVGDPGYQANLARIDQWFASQPGVGYVNWESALPDHLFADHVHLTPEGYRQLAGMLLDRLQKGR